MRSEFVDVGITGIVKIKARFAGLDATVSYDQSNKMVRRTRPIVSIHDLIESLFPYICLPDTGEKSALGRQQDTSREGNKISTMSES